MVKSWFFPVFNGYEIKVVSSNNIREAVEKFEHTKGHELFEEEDTTNALHFFVRAAGLSYIFIPHDVSLGTVTHEVYHAVSRMLKEHDVDDDEAVAYHLGYMVQQISDWRWSWK